MVHRESYVPHRRLLYGLLWLTAVAELGLTAFRIHSTRRAFGTHGKSPTILSNKLSSY